MRAYGIALEEEDPDLVLVGFDTTLDLCEDVPRLRPRPRGAALRGDAPGLQLPDRDGLHPGHRRDHGLYRGLDRRRRADVVIGKPHGEIVRAAQERLGLAPGEMAMVGDRLYTDVRTGVDHGLCAILVLSGEGTLADIETMHIEPDLIFARLGSMIPYL